MKAKSLIKILISLLLLSTVVFTSCVSSGRPKTAKEDKDEPTAKSDGKAPGWFLDLNSEYPDSEYLAVVGEGDTRRDAESDAAGALTRIFKTEIKVDTTSIMRYHELDSGTESSAEVEREMEKEVTLGAEQTLFNVKYSDPFTDSRARVHVVGYIDRKETGRIYREKIDKNSTRIVSFMEQEQKNDGLITKYAFMDAAMLFGKNNEVLLEQLMIIHPVSKKMIELPYNIDELSERHSAIAKQMVFDVYVENDNENKVTDIVKNVLSEQGFSIGADGKLSVTGEVKIEPVQLDNDYENIRWYLTLDMRDEHGTILVSFNKNQRETAINENEAIARGYREMAKNIEDKFMNEFVKHLDSLVLK
jgi:hypothetical protein